MTKIEVTPSTIDITVSITGKIPRRSFENYSPYFSIKEIYKEPISDEARVLRHQELYKQVERYFNNARENIRIEELQEQFKNLRFTLNPVTGKKYPHVTDILYWDADFYINPDKLTQYGARGSAIHEMINHYLLTHSERLQGSWNTAVINRRDLIILKTGSLRLIDTLQDINFLGFIEKYGKDFEFGMREFRAFNEEHFYCGQPDCIGKYKGENAIFDWKCRGIKDDDFKQMAAYTKLDFPGLKDITTMVGVPLDPNNKSGYGRPVVCNEIEKYFNLFLRDRADYRDKFGI